MKINGKIVHVLGLEELVLLQMALPLKSIYKFSKMSIKIPRILFFFFNRTRENNSKTFVEPQRSELPK